MTYTIEELQKRSDRLEKMERDARLDLLEAFGEKITEISEQMRNTSIDFTDKDDKAFDRTMKTMVESKTISDNYKYLRLEIGITKESGDKERVTNPVEARASRQNVNRPAESGDGGGERQGAGKVPGVKTGAKTPDAGGKGRGIKSGAAKKAKGVGRDAEDDGDPF